MRKNSQRKISHTDFPSTTMPFVKPILPFEKQRPASRTKAGLWHNGGGDLIKENR